MVIVTHQTTVELLINAQSICSGGELRAFAMVAIDVSWKSKLTIDSCVQLCESRFIIVSIVIVRIVQVTKPMCYSVKNHAFARGT
jgi:hypothetical protein